MGIPTHLHSGHAALRRGRIELPGQVYLLTAATAGRQPLFAHFAGACAAARCHRRPEIVEPSALLAWVLMPDHAHWLVQLGEGDRLPAFANRMKSSTARACNREISRSGQVWARAYHDHALRRDEDLLAVARYVIANPVRAGLVRRVGDYPFWDAVWL